MRRGPLAHRQRVPLGAAQKSPARAACTRRAGAHAEDGEGRRICLARNSALAEGEIRRPQPLLAERVGLKAAHNRGECAGDGLLLRPVVGARKRISEMAGALNPRRPSRDPDLLLPPDPDGPPVLPPFSRGRMNRGKCRLAGNWLIVDDNDVGCSARSSCPHADGRRWPPKFFPQRQGGRCSCVDRR